MAQDGSDKRPFHGTISISRTGRCSSRTRSVVTRVPSITLDLFTDVLGVPSHFPYTVRISAGLSEEGNITAWDLDGVDAYRKKIAASNDGTLPLEPYQRLSQALFEAWLKQICDKSPLTELRFGCKVESIQETGSETSILVTDEETGQRRKIVSKYVCACDGASSRIRRGLNIPLDGGPV
jgi:FAD-dependent monooxygenase